jgi:hypothetical protein
MVSMVAARMRPGRLLMPAVSSAFVQVFKRVAVAIENGRQLTGSGYS